MTRLTCLLAATLALVAPQTPVFRSTADVVPLFVTVTDAGGRLVTGLPRDVFEVLDNGQPQPITLFDASAQPVRLMPLIDLSGSMSDNLGLLRRACTELFAHLASGDSARGGTFGQQIVLAPEFSRDAASMMELFPSFVSPTAPTPLWRAVDRAMTELAKAPMGRRVILVLSDGKDSDPAAAEKPVTAAQIVERSRREDIMVYAVGLRSAPGPISPGGVRSLSSVLASTTPDPGLSALAHETGGGYVGLSARDDLAQAFAHVIEELHSQYLIGFAPPGRDGLLHTIEVRLKDARLKAQARRTYVAK